MTSLELDDDARARQIASRLRALAAPLGLPTSGITRAVSHALRVVAARVVLASARERLLDARREGDTLTLASLPTLPLRRVHALELHDPELESERAALLERPLALWSTIARLAGVTPDAHTRVRAELDDCVEDLALGLFAGVGPRPCEPCHR